MAKFCIWIILLVSTSIFHSNCVYALDGAEKLTIKIPMQDNSGVAYREDLPNRPVFIAITENKKYMVVIGSESVLQLYDLDEEKLISSKVIKNARYSFGISFIETDSHELRIAIHDEEEYDIYSLYGMEYIETKKGAYPKASNYFIEEKDEKIRAQIEKNLGVESSGLFSIRLDQGRYVVLAERFVPKFSPMIARSRNENYTFSRMSKSDTVINSIKWSKKGTLLIKTKEKVLSFNLDNSALTSSYTLSNKSEQNSPWVYPKQSKILADIAVSDNLHKYDCPNSDSVSTEGWSDNLLAKEQSGYAYPIGVEGIKSKDEYTEIMPTGVQVITSSWWSNGTNRALLVLPTRKVFSSTESPLLGICFGTNAVSAKLSNNISAESFNPVALSNDWAVIGSGNSDTFVYVGHDAKSYGKTFEIKVGDSSRGFAFGEDQKTLIALTEKSIKKYELQAGKNNSSKVSILHQAIKEYGSLTFLHFGNYQWESQVSRANNKLAIFDPTGQVHFFQKTDSDFDYIGTLYITSNGGLFRTQEGYFESYGSDFLYKYLMVSKGSEKPMSIESFYDAFYRPDIVKAKLRGEDVRPLIGDLTIEKALNNPPPIVQLSDIPESTALKRIKIPYTINPDKGGIAEVRVFQNGKLISSDGIYKDAPNKVGVPFGMSSKDASNARNIKLKATYGDNTQSVRDHLVVRRASEKLCNPCIGEVEVDIIPGEENTITVVAFNRDNTIQSVPATVSFKSTLPKEENHLWVLGIGINEFKEISALKNAKNDAIDFVCTYTGQNAKSKISNCAEKGQAQGLFKPENIHVVDVLTDQEATKANIQKSLAEVANKAKPGDTFVWFVASHGMIDGNGLYGIVTHDTQCLQNNCRENIAGQLTSNEILEDNKKIAAMKQLMVFDTCHSGGLDSKLSGLYDARMTLLAKNMGLHMYASAQATELALDGAPNTNGTFTAQLLKGIKGAAPKNNQNQISVMTLGEFAKEKTIQATKSETDNPIQTPVIQHFGEDAGLVLMH